LLLSLRRLRFQAAARPWARPRPRRGPVLRGRGAGCATPLVREASQSRHADRRRRPRGRTMSTAAVSVAGRDPGAQLRFALQVAASLIVMTIGALVMLLVAIGTGFRARRFYSEQIAAGLGRIVLAIFGVRFVVHADAPYPAGQVVYISNHTSTIDVFVLVALGLPNARFFLSGYLRKILPLGLIGYLIGIFW